MVFFKKIIREGEELPKGYGLAYRDYCMNIAVAYIIPFNWIVRWLREFYFWIVVPSKLMPSEKIDSLNMQIEWYKMKVGKLYERIDKLEKENELQLDLICRLQNIKKEGQCPKKE